MQSSRHPARSANQSAARQQMMEIRARMNNAVHKCNSAQARKPRARGINSGKRDDFNSFALVKKPRQRHAAACTPQQFLVCGSTGRRQPVLLASSRLASKNEFMSCTWLSRFSQFVAFNLQAYRRLRPNPSTRTSPRVKRND